MRNHGEGAKCCMFVMQALLDNLRDAQKGENGHSAGPKQGGARKVGFLEEVFYPLTGSYFDSKARGRNTYRYFGC